MTEPTDAEIIALADETRTAEGGANGYILPISFARAVLAKWGTPAPVGAGEVVAWVDERAIGWLKNSRAHSATITTTLGKAKSSERPMPLHGTPQPTQPQAGAVPMTDEQKHARNPYWNSRGAASIWLSGFAAAELWYRIGIKGGQHGAP